MGLRWFCVPKWLIKIVLTLGLAIAGIWIIFEVISPVPGTIWAHVRSFINGEESWSAGRSPREIIRYAERRLEGHSKLETVLLPLLHSVQGYIERPVPNFGFSHMGKGVGNIRQFSLAPGLTLRLVSSSEQLGKALNEASPGTVIEIQPGRYKFNHYLLTRQAGTANLPITIRALERGKVFIEFDAEEGFVVNQPYWVFENLNIKGVCQYDHNCEHAFHVVGKAQGIKIRNNRIEDFNAHIKVNGVGNDWPDADGLCGGDHGRGRQSALRARPQGRRGEAARQRRAREDPDSGRS